MEEGKDEKMRAGKEEGGKTDQREKLYITEVNLRWILSDIVPWTGEVFTAVRALCVQTGQTSTTSGDAKVTLVDICENKDDIACHFE